MKTTLERTTRERLISTWVPRELADLLDQAAREADRSRSAEVRIAIRQHLERNDPEQEESHHAVSR